MGLTEQEVRERYPAVYQRVYERVKPERDQNRRASYRERWWIHGEPRASFRPALAGLDRYIATVETLRHRFFVFLDKSILPDNKLIAIAFDDAYFLGVLSSRIHVAWSLAAGSHLGVGNDPVYVKTACFEKFPFPAASEAQQARIRAIAERLDAHRKRQQERHPTLTLTDMYNVLERLRAFDPNPDRQGGQPGDANARSLTVAARTQADAVPLSPKERTIHDQGLVAVLKQLHDELDAAVADAYGWPVDLPDGEILQRLVDLNARRAAEEAAGHIRWLRPDYERTRAGVEPVQAALVEEDAGASHRASHVSAIALARVDARTGTRRARRAPAGRGGAQRGGGRRAFWEGGQGADCGVAGDVGVVGSGGGGSGAVWRVVIGVLSIETVRTTQDDAGIATRRETIQRDKSSSSI